MDARRRRDVEARGERGNGVKLKKRSAHVWVEVDGKAWRLSLDSHGNLTARGKHQRKRVTLTARELVTKSKQLRDGSLCL